MLALSVEELKIFMRKQNLRVSAGNKEQYIAMYINTLYLITYHYSLFFSLIRELWGVYRVGFGIDKIVSQDSVSAGTDIVRKVYFEISHSLCSLFYFI